MKIGRILMILAVSTAFLGRAAADDQVYTEKGITWRQNSKAGL